MNFSRILSRYIPEWVLPNGKTLLRWLVITNHRFWRSWLACRLLTAVCVWEYLDIFFWMPATLFFLTETADWWNFALFGHLAWLDEGSLFPLNYDFYSWICLHSWNSLDYDLPVPAAISGASPCPRFPGCWPRASSELHCPPAPGDQHSAQVGLFTNIDHWPWLCSTTWPGRVSGSCPHPWIDIVYCTVCVALGRVKSLN